jgi:hypothetical protein
VVVIRGVPVRDDARPVGERIRSRLNRREQLEAKYAALERAERQTVEDVERMAALLQAAVARERQAERELSFEQRAHQVTARALEANQAEVRRLAEENRELRRRIKNAALTLRKLAVRRGNQAAVTECDATLDSLDAEAR